MAGYDKVVGLGLSEAVVGGSAREAPCGGEGAGGGPVGRGESGWKWSPACDRDGIPVAWAADANGQTLLEPALADAARRGLHLDIERLRLGRGYAGEPVRRTCLDCGIDDIARSPKTLLGFCVPRVACFAVSCCVRWCDDLSEAPSERVQKFKLREEGITADAWDRDEAGCVVP